MKSFQDFKQLVESKEVVDEGVRNITPQEAHKMLKDIGDDVVWKDYYQLRSDKQSELHALGKKLKMKAPSSGKELGRHVHDVLQNKVSKLREETEQLDERRRPRWDSEYGKKQSDKLNDRSTKTIDSLNKHITDMLSHYRSKEIDRKLTSKEKDMMKNAEKAYKDVTNAVWDLSINIKNLYDE
jgi:hypothetical protein